MVARAWQHECHPNRVPKTSSSDRYTAMARSMATRHH